MTDGPRLVVLDVDGTLLLPDGTLPDRRAAALSGLAGRVPTILATGKTWPSVVDLVERFGLPGPHAICNGAALATADGRIRTLDALAADVAHEVAATLTARGVAFATYLADGSIVCREDDPRFRAITDLGEAAPVVGEAGDTPVLKVLAVLREDEEDDLRGLRDDRARIQRTGPAFLEWNAPGASKGHALEVVVGELGLALGDVVAVGDSENDVPMLLAAGHGVAVAESSAAAVAAADEHLVGDVADYLDALCR